jgi:hypothetical protein
MPRKALVEAVNGLQVLAVFVMDAVMRLMTKTNLSKNTKVCAQVLSKRIYLVFEFFTRIKWKGGHHVRDEKKYAGVRPAFFNINFLVCCNNR